MKGKQYSAFGETIQFYCYRTGLGECWEVRVEHEAEVRIHSFIHLHWAKYSINTRDKKMNETEYHSFIHDCLLGIGLGARNIIMRKQNNLTEVTSLVCRQTNA